MRSKRLIAALLAFIMIASMLLTSCSKSEEGGESEESKAPSASVECTHAKTEIKGAVAPSCVTEGYSGDKVCSACGEIVSKGSSIALTAHIYDSGRTTKAPTCMETGVFSYFCTTCGISKTEALPQVAHSDEFHDALDGGHTITCSHCTKSEYATHTPVDEGTLVEASCLEPAYTLHTCADCESSYKVYDTASAELGHSWGDWQDTLEADCTHEGEKIHVCEVCFDTESVSTPINPSKHNYELMSHEDASCTQEGSTVYECADCHSSKTETLAITDHSFGDSVTSDDGWTRKVCETCSYTLSSYDASNAREATLEAADLADDNFEVQLETANIVFPQNVVSQFKDSEEKLSIKADTMNETQKNDLLAKPNLTAEQKERLESVEVYDFGVTQGSYVESFNEAVTVTLPYELGEGEEADGIVIWYVKDDGNVESVLAAYNATNKTVTFSVSHFSYYAVAYEETQEMRCRKGNHNYTKDVFTVEANCYTFGYTYVECGTCHHTQINNIITKLDHSYSEIINPTVTCDEGGYKYKYCTNLGCGHTVTYEYVRATGHKPTGPATCTDPAMCASCNKVAIPAKGHSYTAWETIVAATGSNNGISRRYCLGCGTVEEKVIASTGEITDLDFESYMELIDYVLCEKLGLGKGEFVFSSSSAGFETLVTIKVDANDKDTVFSIDVSQEYPESGYEYAVQLIYKNGVLFAYSEDEDGKYVQLTDIESQLGTIEYLGDNLKEVFEEINESMEMAVEVLDDIIIGGLGSFSEQIDELLADAGVDYTYAELESLYNSIKKFYAYTSLRLGKDTGVTAPEGVELPSRNDLLNILDAFMTVETNAQGHKVYSLDATDALDAIENLCAWLDENTVKPLSDVIYALLEEEILAHFPDLTTWDKVVAKIKTEFSGSLTVSDAVDKIMDSITGGDAEKLEAIYDAINSFAVASGAEGFDIEDVILSYSDYTLDTLAQEMMDAENIAQVYDALSEQLKSVTFAQMTEMPEGYFESLGSAFDAITEDMAASLVFDAAGNLLSIDAGGSISIESEGDAPAAFEDISIGITFKRDNKISITIPTVATDAMADMPTASFDANGNLIVKAPDSSYDYNFGIQGSVKVDISKDAVLDTEMSEQYGFDVYRMLETSYSSSDIRYHNGSFYTSSYEHSWEYKINSKVALQEILDATSPDESTLNYIGYTALEGEEQHTVYKSALGYVYSVDGVWYLMDENNSSYDYTWDEENGESRVYTSVSSVKYADAIASMQISNIDNWDEEIVDDQGNSYDLARLYLSVICDGWNGDTLSCDASIDKDGKIWLLDYESVGYGRLILSQKITEADFPDHIYYTIGYQSGDFGFGSSVGTDSYYESIYFADGTPVTGKVEVIYFAKYSPVYYAKLDDKAFVNINNLDRTSVIGREEMTLPNGKTLYIVGGNYSTDENGAPDNGTVYGYVKLGSGYCAATACQVENGKVTLVNYKNADTYISKNLQRELDIEDFVQKTSTGYTISSELFAELEKYTCGGVCRVTLAMEKEENGVNYQIELALLNDYKEAPEETPEIPGLDWYEWFDKGGNYESYTVHTNEDGSVSIYFRNGGKINVSYDTQSYVEITEKLSVKDTEKSNKTGLDIYSNTYYVSYYRDYVKVDNDYYTFNSYSCIDPETVTSTKDFINSAWEISNLSYRYDFTDENNVVHPVYDGYIRFESYHDGSSIHCYFIFKDGSLKVLTGVEELNEGRIKFESMVSVSEYLSSLTVGSLNEGHSYVTTVYINGSRVTLSNSYFELYEGEKHVAGIWIHYYTNGSTTYIITDYDNIDDYIEILEKADVSDGTVYNEHENSAQNGIFDIVSFEFKDPETSYFVKLAGKLYFYDYDSNHYYYETYLRHRMSEEEFKEYFYNIEYDKNGYPVYIQPEDMQTVSFDDGTVFYYREGNTDGFLKCPDGYYVRAQLIEDVDGNQSVECYELSRRVRLNNVNMDSILSDCVIFSNGGTLVTVKPEIVDTLREYFGESILDGSNFHMEFESDWYRFYAYGETITGWFQK